MMRRARFVPRALAALLLMATGDAAAQERATSTPIADPTTFALLVENDAFHFSEGSTDQHYTNGVQAVWTRFAPLLGPNVVPRNRVLRRLPRIGCDPLHPPHEVPCGAYALGVGQTMHTPTDIRATGELRDDRPYVGWAYLMGSATSAWRPRQARGYRMLTLEAQLGVIGLSSGAQALQSMAHWWWASDAVRPQGWHNQLADQLGANAALYYSITVPVELYGDLHFEVIPQVSGHVGTVLNAARGGARVRLGYRMPPEFGAGRIPVTVGLGAEDAWYDRLWFALSAELQGRAVAWNSLVSGGYRDAELRSRSRIEATRTGHDLFYGVSAGIDRSFGIAYRRVARSREFGAPFAEEGAQGAQGAHRFGIFVVTLIHAP